MDVVNQTLLSPAAEPEWPEKQKIGGETIIA